MAKLFKLSPVMVNGQKYEVSHDFSDNEIGKILIMPKVGKKLTFVEAYNLRWHELSYMGRIFNCSIQSMPLHEYCVSRNYYIEFDEGEINVVQRA